MDFDKKLAEIRNKLRASAQVGLSDDSSSSQANAQYVGYVPAPSMAQPFSMSSFSQPQPLPAFNSGFSSMPPSPI